MKDTELLTNWWNLRMKIGRLFHAKHQGTNSIGMRGRDRIIGMINYRGAGLSQKELAKFVHLRPGSLTDALTNLEEEGYVNRERDPKDRRIWRVSLTEKGEKRASEIAADHKAFVEHLMEGISHADKVAMNRAVLQMTKNFEHYYGKNAE